MRNIRRAGLGFSAALGLAIAGTMSAYAYSWAYSRSPLRVSVDGSVRGGGYGTLSQVSYGKARLSSYLSDSKTDSMRTFVDVTGTKGSQSRIGTQSGRRSDGGTSYASMANKYFYSEYPAGVSQYYYYVKVCMDRSWAFDPCSGVRTHSGL